jgi:hypothetical protein
MFPTTIRVAVQACRLVIEMLAGLLSKKVLGKAMRKLLGWGGERKDSGEDNDLHNMTNLLSNL